MNQLLKVFRNNASKKLLLGAYALVLISFFLPNKINSIALLLFGVISLPYVSVNFRTFFKAERVILYALFGVLCLGLIYSNNSKEGMAIIERHLSLLLLPFLVSSYAELDRKQKYLLLNVFIFSAAIAGAYCLIYAGVNYFESGTAYPTGQEGHFVYNRFMHHRLSAAIGMHAIYLSFYCSIATIAVLQKLLFSPAMKRVELFGSSLLLLFFFILIYLLKSALFAALLPFCCVLLLLLKLKSQSFNTNKKIAFIAILVLAGLFAFQGMRSKLDTFKTTYHFEDTQMRPLAIRLALWNSSWQVIKKQPLLGVGTGDSQAELMGQYQSVGFAIGEQNRFNSHNMYLQYWLSNGVLGIIAFLTFLLLLFIKSYRHQNILFFTFSLLFAFFSHTESTMLKQKGLVFFIFFASLFLIAPNSWTYPIHQTDENTSGT